MSLFFVQNIAGNTVYRHLIMCNNVYYFHSFDEFIFICQALHAVDMENAFLRDSLAMSVVVTRATQALCVSVQLVT